MLNGAQRNILYSFSSPSTLGTTPEAWYSQFEEYIFGKIFFKSLFKAKSLIVENRLLSNTDITYILLYF